MRSPYLYPWVMCFLLLSGCSSMKNMFTPQPEAPKTGSLTQHYALVDNENRHYGVVEIDPVTGGKITDVQGRLIGYIVPPAAQTPQTVTAPAPLAAQPLEPIPPVAAYPYR